MPNLTPAQQATLDNVSEHYPKGVAQKDAKSLGYDVRVLNNLCKLGQMHLTNGGVYLLGAKPKKAEPIEDPDEGKSSFELHREKQAAKAKKSVDAPTLEDGTVSEEEVIRERKPAPKAKKEKIVQVSTVACLCGCGQMPNAKRSFSQGHDARLHSLVLRFVRGKDEKRLFPNTPETMTFLRSAKWMTKEIMAKISE